MKYLTNKVSFNCSKITRRQIHSNFGVLYAWHTRSLTHRQSERHRLVDTQRQRQDIICLFVRLNVIDKHKNSLTTAYHLLATNTHSTRHDFFIFVFSTHQSPGVGFTREKLNSLCFVRLIIQWQLLRWTHWFCTFCLVHVCGAVRPVTMSKGNAVQPLINFTNLKGFQAMSNDGKIETLLFLDAAKEIVAQIGKWRERD